MKSVLILVAGLLISGAASAHYPWTQNQCKQYSTFVRVITEFRSQGATPEVTKKAALEAAIEMHDASFFMQDEKDKQSLMLAVDLVYQSTTVGPESLEKDSYNSCMRILVPEGRSV